MKKNTEDKLTNLISPTCTNCGKEEAIESSISLFKPFKRSRRCKECGEKFRLSNKQWIAQIVEEITSWI